jgi:hypothetical protein
MELEILRKQLNEIINKELKSLEQISKDIGVSTATLYRFINGEAIPDRIRSAKYSDYIEKKLSEKKR